jgi:hypothetical protein
MYFVKGIRPLFPMPVVVQAGLVVVVLALESDRIGQADLLGEFRRLKGAVPFEGYHVGILLV